MDAENTIREYYLRKEKWSWGLFFFFEIIALLLRVVPSSKGNRDLMLALEAGLGLPVLQFLAWKEGRTETKQKADSLISDLKRKGTLERFTDNLIQIAPEAWDRHSVFCTEQYVISSDPIMALTYDEIEGFYFSYKEHINGDTEQHLVLVTGKDYTYRIPYIPDKKAVWNLADEGEETNLMSIATIIRENNPEVLLYKTEWCYRRLSKKNEKEVTQAHDKLVEAYIAGAPAEKE